MKELKGKTAVVTGAGSGIGRSIAHALAKAGMNVVVADLSADGGETVAAEVRDLGAKAISITTDVTKLESVEALADRAYDAFGSVEVLVNNAGVSWRPLRTIMDASLSDWKFLVDVNIWGVVYGQHVFLPRMGQQPGEKHIVNTASLGAILPVPGMAPYSATKGAIISMSEAMALELAPRGFGVTLLCPGIVRTNVAATSEAQRAPEDKIVNREIPVYDNAWWANKYTTLVLEAPIIGEKVREAIQENRLYLLPHYMKPEIAEERFELVFGEATRLEPAW